MVTLADYLVLSDNEFDIGDQDFSAEFQLPSDFTVGTNLAKPILQFMWRPMSDNGNFRIWVIHLPAI